MKHVFLKFLPLALSVLVAACAAQPPAPTPSAGNAVYKIGQPYQVGGAWYYPHEDYSYDETGIASWYGADFHEQKTANGEIFNKNELTAAHKTLPLPTLARVTNLDNGRSIVVRINDRGPFSGARIIDMSQRASQLLGFEAQGTAKVRVQVLADESKAIADAMRHYGGGAQVASAITTPLKVSTASLPPSSLISSDASPEPSSFAQAPLTPVETQTLQPVLTTPATHAQLLVTKPVQEVVQVPLTGHTMLFVQAGAFTMPENAAKLQQKLSGFGTVAVSPIVINGTKFYRVRVGPVADVPHADALVAKIRQAGVTTPRTVVD